MQPYFQSRRSSFAFAFAGIGYLLRTQPNARIHLLATIGVIVLGILFQLPLAEWTFLAVAIGLVWLAELFNTAVEALTDLASPETHPLAKIAKDSAAGAVLVAAITASVIGVLVFLPKISGWIFRILE